MANFLQKSFDKIVKNISGVWRSDVIGFGNFDDTDHLVLSSGNEIFIKNLETKKKIKIKMVSAV